MAKAAFCWAHGCMETGTAQTPCSFQVLLGSFIPQGAEQGRECPLAPTAPHSTEAVLTTGGFPVGGGEGGSENQSEQAQVPVLPEGGRSLAQPTSCETNQRLLS